MGPQLFQLDFEQYRALVTHSWLKSVWEKVFLFRIIIEVSRPEIQPPREGDERLVPLLVRLGFDSKDLFHLNWVQLHQQFLFVSDIMDASGLMSDQIYWKRRSREECWSCYKFPVQSLLPQDLALWRRAILQIQHALRAPLGRFLWDGHKLWEWRLDKAHNRLLRLHLDGMDIYTPSLVPQYAYCPNCWTCLRVDQPQTETGNIC